MNIRRFSNILLTLTLLLPLQLLLGMWINLFVEVPNPLAGSFFASGGGIVLIVHILNGLTIASLAIVVAVLAARLHKVVPLRLSMIAIVFVFLSIGSGASFVLLGQNDVFSYTMVIGFVFSVVLLAFVGRLAMQPSK